MLSISVLSAVGTLVTCNPLTTWRGNAAWALWPGGQGRAEARTETVVCRERRTQPESGQDQPHMIAEHGQPLVALDRSADCL